MAKKHTSIRVEENILKDFKEACDKAEMTQSEAIAILMKGFADGDITIKSLGYRIGNA